MDNQLINKLQSYNFKLLKYINYLDLNCQYDSNNNLIYLGNNNLYIKHFIKKFKVDYISREIKNVSICSMLYTVRFIQYKTLIDELKKKEFKK